MRKTKFRITVSTFSSIILLLSSCTQLNEENLVYNNNIQLTCLQSSWTSNRAITDNEGQGYFSEGDKIEVLTKGEKKHEIVQLVYTNGQWSPHLQRNNYGAGGLTLSATYPVLPQDDSNQTIRKINIPIDQNNDINYISTDILFASTTISHTDISATLQFSHALHRININLKGTIPDDLAIEVKSLAYGHISLEDGTVTADLSTNYVWMTPYRKSSNSYSIIILPQETHDFTRGEGLIRLTSKGKSASYIFNANAEKFDSGMQTTINLTLNTEDDSNIDLDFSNQTYWVYGVNAPDFPGKENIPSMQPWESEVEDGIWFRYTYENMSTPLLYENQYLTWKENCGWFDCNKTFGYKGDGQMCWAAAASNLIHWWLAQNKKYIEAYDKKYGPEYDNIYRPEKYSKMTQENQQHSEVFNFFKSSFDNQGSWDTGGVNWFINGDKKNLNNCYRTDFYGFFSKVFSTKDVVATETKDTSKGNFNHWIKEAFRHNRAIGFSAYEFAGTNTPSHAMVIWGAEFDVDGNVAFIYFCDNNLADSEPNHASIKRYKIIYDKSNIPELKGDYAYLTPLDNTNGTPSKARSSFTSLTLVDLRLDLWQKAFPDIK